MLGNVLFNKTTGPVLKKSLDASMLRARTIANNIANVNTPGYRRLEVSFEEELRRSLSTTRLKGSTTRGNHIELGKKRIDELNPRVDRPVDPTLPAGLNNVDIDTEMAKLAENQILFNFSSNALKGLGRKLNAAIQAKSLPIQ